MTQPSGGTVRTAKAKLEADASGYKRELVSATHVTTGLAKEIDRLGSLAKQKASEVARAAREQEQAQMRALSAADRVGKGMLVVGAGIAAGIALATNAAIQWESAWTGVAKTVDGTDAQLAALEEELREMARSLPATHQEIAAVAEAAGQLGVATGDIAEFTAVMIALGESTNLTADEAATAIAQLMNVMGTAPDEVENLASALVELGNNGASTEREIVMMAQRIAGAGSIVGASEADVLALANALASVGIEVEAGGSAISRVMVDIETAVSDGSEEVESFAEVAGMSSRDFAAAWRTDPVAALDLFVQGLGRMDAAGQNVFGTLEDLGLSEIRTRDALLRLASSGDLLTDSLADGARAWDENLALAEEAERRYGTTAAQLQVARNQVTDFAVDVGETFLPILADAASLVGGFIDVIQDLPDPLKSALGLLTAVAAAIAIAGGAALIAVPKIAAFKAALGELEAGGGKTGAIAGRLGGALRGITGFLFGPWGAAIGLGITALSAFGIAQADTRAHVDELSQTLDQQSGAVTDNTRAWLAHKLEQEGVLADAERLGIDLNTLVDAILGEESALSRVNAVLAEHDEQMGTIGPKVEEYRRQLEAQGLAAEEVSRRTLEYQQMLEGQDRATDNVRGKVDGLTGDLAAAEEATRRQAAATGEATTQTLELDPATRDLANAFDVSAQSAEDVADAVDQLDEELQQLFDRVFGLQNAEDDLAEQFARLTEQIQQQQEAGVAGAGSLDGMTQAAIDNRSEAQKLLELYGALAVETIRSTGSQEEAAAVAEDFEAALDDLEEQTGFNVREMEGYNDVVDEIERLIDVTFETSGVVNARRQAELLQESLANIDRFIDIHFNVSSSGQAPVGSLKVPEKRWGGVIAAQRGQLIPAHITHSPTVLYGERATGMEAFIPKRGNPARSMAILETAARWYGASVVPGSGQVGGQWQWHGQRVASASSTSSGDGSADRRGLLRMAAQEFSQALDGVRIVVDDRGRGRLDALQADYLRRAG